MGQTLAGKISSTKVHVSPDMDKDIVDKAEDERSGVYQSPSRVTRRQTMILAGKIEENNDGSTELSKDLRKTPTRKDKGDISNVQPTERVTRRKTMHSQLPTKDIEEGTLVNSGDFPKVSSDVKKKALLTKLQKMCSNNLQEESP